VVLSRHRAPETAWRRACCVAIGVVVNLWVGIMLVHNSVRSPSLQQEPTAQEE
jgi:hypothetical protein